MKMKEEIYFKSESHSRFENGIISKNSPVKTVRYIYANMDVENEKIYHACIKDENGDYSMVPKAISSLLSGIS